MGFFDERPGAATIGASHVVPAFDEARVRLHPDRKAAVAAWSWSPLYVGEAGAAEGECGHPGAEWSDELVLRSEAERAP